MLRYLTTVGSNSGSTEVEKGSVMDKVLQSNPILEAWGNAKTIRNDNSSRFGKFIELNFNRRGNLIGGTIRTYLLERVRLPVQQKGERNFHIFYQMIKGGTTAEKDLWHIPSEAKASDYNYTAQGGVYDLKHFDDKEEFAEMRASLRTLNFKNEDQDQLLRAMAGILHLGEIQFEEDDDGEGSRAATDMHTTTSLTAACDLLGLDSSSLARTMTTKTLTTRGEVLIKKLVMRDAYASRDALTKAIYGRLFNWIVNTINYSIQVDAALVRADVGVLDIFGFECFQHNSFEQLCINYTNETLQQQFNQYVLLMLHA